MLARMSRAKSLRARGSIRWVGASHRLPAMRGTKPMTVDDDDLTDEEILAEERDKALAEFIDTRHEDEIEGMTRSQAFGAGLRAAWDHLWERLEIIAKTIERLKDKRVAPALDESDRQLMLRALAVQSLESPGFEQACRKIAILLKGEPLFDEFMSLLKDLFP